MIWGVSLWIIVSLINHHQHREREREGEKERSSKVKIDLSQAKGTENRIVDVIICLVTITFALFFSPKQIIQENKTLLKHILKCHFTQSRTYMKKGFSLSLLYRDYRDYIYKPAGQLQIRDSVSLMYYLKKNRFV